MKRGLRDKREWTSWERNYVGKKRIAMASRTLNLMYVRLSAASCKTAGKNAQYVSALGKVGVLSPHVVKAVKLNGGERSR